MRASLARLLPFLFVAACSGQGEDTCHLVGSCANGLEVRGLVPSTMAAFQGATIKVCRGAICEESAMTGGASSLACESFTCSGELEGTSTRLYVNVRMNADQLIDNAVYTIRITSQGGAPLVDVAQPVAFQRDTSCGGECVNGVLQLP